MSERKLPKHWHGTESERLFIDGLGRFAPNDPNDPSSVGMSRGRLLMNYEKAMSRRVRWGTICKEAVLKHVQQARRVCNGEG